MILTVAILIGLAVTSLRARLYHRTLTIPNLHIAWLVVVAVLPQLLAFQIPLTARWIPQDAIPSIQIFSMAGLLIFSAANILSSGFWAMTLGLVSNLVVILLNGGWMPISPETILKLKPDLPETAIHVQTRLGLSKDIILPASQTKLAWLSDCLTLPGWFPYKFAFSIGDVILSIGVFLLLWSFSTDSNVKEVYVSQ